ncbi:hypothetical protein [Bradyrhizobium sp. WSM471]|uniref:hypothetical protein n=1 Tax=Bradyrhizobium sp. WSM471 TaxID=319017 RepID=UPI00024D2CEC|nr:MULTISPECIES: hypothetical protein [Bradyrhizobium]EHR03173.1 hypothetical protein Bra471DRAFT_03941 [Bradyrhizobium sp. WSM471]UFW38405.1 hypothetical protein BcanWSM471_19330 [Bradyrhizobium canariense]
MAQHKSPSDDQAGIASPAPPPWIHRSAAYAPERRARMLEHMARARSGPRATAVSEPLHRAGTTVVSDAFGYAVLFGIIALLFQSRVPLYLGAFLFFSDGERIELALGKIGIRLEPGTVGPEIIKGFVSLFGWFALLASMKASVPAWLAAWMLPDASWSFLAGIALLLAIVEAFATRAMRHALPWFGLESRPDSLACATIKLVLAIGVLALLALLG